MWCGGVWCGVYVCLFSLLLFPVWFGSVWLIGRFRIWSGAGRPAYFVVADSFVLFVFCLLCLFFFHLLWFGSARFGSP